MGEAFRLHSPRVSFHYPPPDGAILGNILIPEAISIWEPEAWLNSTLSAGYRFIDDRNTTFGVRLQHNSTSLWKPEVSETMKDTRMYRYDESIGFYGSHDFNGKGRLSGALDWHIGNFNYYGYNPQWSSFSDENAHKARHRHSTTYLQGSDGNHPTGQMKSHGMWKPECAISDTAQPIHPRSGC